MTRTRLTLSSIGYDNGCLVVCNLRPPFRLFPICKVKLGTLSTIVVRVSTIAYIALYSNRIGCRTRVCIGCHIGYSKYQVSYWVLLWVLHWRCFLCQVQRWVWRLTLLKVCIEYCMLPDILFNSSRFFTKIQKQN